MLGNINNHELHTVATNGPASIERFYSNSIRLFTNGKNISTEERMSCVSVEAIIILPGRVFVNVDVALIGVSSC